MTKWFISVFIFLLLAGCATINIKEQEAGIYKIIDLINNGESKKLIASSNIPFIYDGEIILLQKDINLIWNTLTESGYTLDNPEIVEINRIDEQTYTLFTASMEGKVYFKRHLPEKTVITTVSTTNGIFYFLTTGKKAGDIMIFGMKGPV